MLKDIFITGTDTGVGKTIASAAIIRALIKKGIRVGAMKPIETGCKKTEDRRQKTKDRLIPSDGVFLKKMAEMDDSIDMITPIRYEEPLSPMVASDLEKKPVTLHNVFSAYETLSKKYEFMVVEGAGGLLVPITRIKGIRRKVYYMSDLIKDLKLPMIVVTRPVLGTINHTLLTINESIREEIKVVGIVINYSCQAENTAAEKTNPDVLRELCPAPILGILPYVEDIKLKSIEKLSDCIDLSFLQF
jgi:dethiobiotin synthetase